MDPMGVEHKDLTDTHGHVLNTLQGLVLGHLDVAGCVQDGIGGGLEHHHDEPAIKVQVGMGCSPQKYLGGGVLDICVGYTVWRKISFDPGPGPFQPPPERIGQVSEVGVFRSPVIRGFLAGPLAGRLGSSLGALVKGFVHGAIVATVLGYVILRYKVQSPSCPYLRLTIAPIRATRSEGKIH